MGNAASSAQGAPNPGQLGEALVSGNAGLLQNGTLAPQLGSLIASNQAGIQAGLSERPPQREKMSFGSDLRMLTARDWEIPVLDFTVSV